jgi:hypothetical protein
MVMRLPQEKNYDLRKQIAFFINSKKATMRELQSLIGIIPMKYRRKGFK